MNLALALALALALTLTLALNLNVTLSGVALFVTVFQFSVPASTPRDGESRDQAETRENAQRRGPRVLLTCGDRAVEFGDLNCW